MTMLLYLKLFKGKHHFSFCQPYQMCCQEDARCMKYSWRKKGKYEIVGNMKMG